MAREFLMSFFPTQYIANSVTEYYFNFSKIEYWYGKVIHIENMISFKNVFNISCQTSKTVAFLDE